MAVERSIKMMTLVMFPITTMMIALGPEITRIVFTVKWMPGVWAFYLYCTSPMVIGIMLPMYCAILAIGKSKILLKMSIFLLFLEWGTAVPFIMLFGFTGIALNQPIVAILFFFIYKHVLSKEGIVLKIFQSINYQLVVSIALGIILKFICLQVPVNLFTLIIIFIMGTTGYIIAIYYTNKNLFNELRSYLLKMRIIK